MTELHPEQQQNVVERAERFLAAEGVEHQDCCTFLVFDDGTVTMHFRKPPPPSTVCGDTVITKIESADTVIVMHNLTTGRFWIPESF